MKDTLNETILALSSKEFRSFRYFLKKTGGGNEREDIKLVDMIRKQAHQNMLGSGIYHQLTKRVRAQLEQFLSIENLKHNPTSQIMNYVEVAKYMFSKSLHKQAWSYLMKAEKMAIAHAEYGMLDFIYHIQLSYSSFVYASDYFAPAVPELLEKRKQNIASAKTDTDANSAYALLIHEIGRMLSQGAGEAVEQLINKVLKQFNLEDKIYSEPQIFARIVSITCRALFDANTHVKLKEYAISSYRVMEKKKMFEKVSPDFIMELMLSLSTSTLKTKDYKRNEEYLGLYEFHTQRFRHYSQDKYNYHLFALSVMRADLYINSNRIALAKELMLELYKKYKNDKQNGRMYFILRVNLLTLYFIYGEYAAWLKVMNDMQQRMTLLAKLGGVGMLIYSELYRVMVYYENDDADYAYTLLNKLKRSYSSVLQKPESKREVFFIKIMERITNDASYIKSKQFKTDYDKFIKLKEYIPGDREYISLNAWLASKRTGKTYYECLLELAK